MSISNRIKEILKENKAQVELFQLSIISSLAGLIFSEFIKNFKQVYKPVHKVFIPELQQVRMLLDPDGEFMVYLSNNLIDDIVKNELFREFSNIDDFALFNNEDIEILKAITDLYILPNVSRVITSTIANKFGIGNPEVQLFVESNEIDIFQRQSIYLNKSYTKYIVDQTILHMLNITPKIKKIVTMIENNSDIIIPDDSHAFLTIGNENAISLIHFNKQVINNSGIMELLKFVTSTVITSGTLDDDEQIYRINTSPYNQAVITILKTKV
jgi:hypothetical protein